MSATAWATPRSSRRPSTRRTMSWPNWWPSSLWPSKKPSNPGREQSHVLYAARKSNGRRHVNKEEVEKLISERYRSLPPKLKVAARHVLDAPRDIAIQSMRSVAADAELQPATMLRLARELGFRSYAAFREIYVNWLSSSEMTFVARAKSLRKRRV